MNKKLPAFKKNIINISENWFLIKILNFMNIKKSIKPLSNKL